MHSITVGVTGSLVRGDIMDVQVKSLERAIQDYDSQLYFRWNPLKRRGHGVWELRRRPNKKTIVETIPYGGNTYCIIDYKEHDLENHVWDLPRLGYDLLQRLRESDQFAMCNYEVGQHHRLSKHLLEMENKAANIKLEAQAKSRADMLYNLKQDKGIINDFREKLLSGVDPNHLMRYWGKQK